MSVYRFIKKNLGLLSIWVATLLVTYNYSSSKTPRIVQGAPGEPQIYLDNRGNPIHPGVLLMPDGSYYFYNHTSPIIFIGGMPRSGTTLMRVMLDAHSDVRCGEETRLVPRLLGMRSNWYRSDKERNRLKEAGVTEDVVNKAMRAFILEVIVGHGVPNKVPCNKDPFSLKSQEYLLKLFPNAKFLLMIRDGRASAHSIIERKVSISGFDITSYRDVLTKWNTAIQSMYQQCISTPQTCLPVYYEQLVLHPESQLRKISTFLGLSWQDAMVNHEKYVGNIGISSVEKSTSQVQKPVYLEALTAWYGHIRKDVDKDLETIAPMLGKLGYQYHFDGKPSYGTPDQAVLDKLGMSQFEHEWQEGVETDRQKAEREAREKSQGEKNAMDAKKEEFKKSQAIRG
jgi:protein-tyrosine sulfotransferase